MDAHGEPEPRLVTLARDAIRCWEWTTILTDEEKEQVARWAGNMDLLAYVDWFEWGRKQCPYENIRLIRDPYPEQEAESRPQHIETRAMRRAREAREAAVEPETVYRLRKKMEVDLRRAQRREDEWEHDVRFTQRGQAEAEEDFSPPSSPGSTAREVARRPVVTKGSRN